LDSDSNDSALNRNTFGSLNFDAAVAEGINLHLAGQYFAAKYKWSSEALGQDLFGYGTVAGAPLFERVWDEETITGEARLAVEWGNHTIVIGGEISRCEMDHVETYLPALRKAWGAWAPDISYVSNASETKCGVYVNDTIKLGKLTLVPGIRYDHHSIVGSITSPSLGLTVPLGDETMARFYLGHGFAYPSLSHLSGTFWDSWTGVGNRNLKPEKVTVVQGGFETNAVPYMHLAATLFHYAGDDFWAYTLTDPWFYKNQYDTVRNGFSVEVNSVPVYNLSALAGITYVKKSNTPTVPDPTGFVLFEDDITKIDLALSYDDNRFVRAKLLGMYAWWDSSLTSADHEYNNFLWDFVCGLKVYSTPKTTVEIFGTVHNLFNSSHYSDRVYKNPDRWAEAGLKVNY
jgi:outer membrane cobalamin receptor